MKISELNTDQGCDVLCAITPAVANIATDADFVNAFNLKLKREDIATPIQQVSATAKILTNLIPLMLKTHRNDVYEIIATLNCMNVDEVSRLGFLKTAALIRDVIKDKEMLDFFKSCVNGEQGG